MKFSRSTKNTFAVMSLFILNVVSLVSLEAHSLEVKSCRSVLDNKSKVKSEVPSQIVESNREEELTEAIKDLTRMSKKVIHFAINDSSKKLEDGNYLYIVDNLKNLFVIPRFINPYEDHRNKPYKEYLSLHKYLRLAGMEHVLIQDHIKQDVKVVGAGEIVIRYGHVLKINNKSGSFRGGEEHLKFAEKIIFSHILNPVSPKGLKLIDVSNPKNTILDSGHTTALREVKAELDILNKKSLLETKYKLLKAFENLALYSSEEKYADFLQQMLENDSHENKIDFNVMFNLSHVKDIMLSPNESIPHMLLDLESNGKIKYVNSIIQLMGQFNSQNPPHSLRN